jgi:hypothetical protein
LQGRVHSADLAALLPIGSPHTLRGVATVELTEFIWEGEQVERLAGTLTAQQAAMSRSLLDEMASKTGFQCPQASDGVPVDGDSSLVALDAMAVRFQLSSEGLTFWGQCPAEEAGMPENCMATSGRQPLLIAPPFYNWHLGVLVQTLAGPGAAWLPATREAVDMAGRLPLPVK